MVAPGLSAERFFWPDGQSLLPMLSSAGRFFMFLTEDTEKIKDI